MTHNFIRTTCDICGKSIEYHINSDNEWIEYKTKNKVKPWPNFTCVVKFLTEQTEGTNCNPYFDTVQLEVCPECYNRMLNSWPITAYGAQGFNTYKLEE